MRLESADCIGVKEWTDGWGGSGSRGTAGVFLCVDRKQWETVNSVCNEGVSLKTLVQLLCIWFSTSQAHIYSCCSQCL